MTRILCIEDEPTLLRTLGANLRARGYDIDLTATGELGVEVASAKKPDVVIVDLGLPGMSGLEVIRSLRQWTQVPIIVLSARDTEFDKIGALDAGADDYVSKPFGMGELLARVRAALRRATHTDESPIVVTDDFTIDLRSHAVSKRSADNLHSTDDVKLTPTEWGVVEMLVRNAGRLVTGRELLQSVWGPQYGDETNYLRVHMTHIRRKLEPEPAKPRYFVTEAGMGYRFVPAATTD